MIFNISRSTSAVHSGILGIAATTCDAGIRSVGSKVDEVA